MVIISAKTETTNNMEDHYTAKITTGCTAFCFSVDDQSWFHEDDRYEFQDKDYFVKSVAKFLHDKIISGEIDPQRAVEMLDADEFGCSDHVCDQCGDSIEWEIRKIPKIK